MNRFTRVLAGALAAVLAAGSLAACGEKKRKLPEKQVLDHVYKYETKTLATYDEVKWDEDAQKDFKGYTEVQGHGTLTGGLCLPHRHRGQGLQHHGAVRLLRPI